MEVHITATTSVDPALFAFIIRRELVSARPDAVVTVRPIRAPRGRRFHTIETDGQGAFLRDDIGDWLNFIRDDLESDDPILLCAGA